MAVEIAGGCPALEVVWERDLACARALSCADFDAVVLACDSAKPAIDALAELRARGPLPPAFVLLDGAGELPLEDLRAAGASDVICARDADARPRLEHALLRGSPRLRAPLYTAPRTVRASERRGARAWRTQIVGASPQLAEVLELVGYASGSSATVLLTGETGTGKELLARELHERSPRRTAAFLAVNCAAFPEALLESELFGHQRGAFTGADRDKSGLFEAADGGTLFLDEIGETTRPFQAKLLRVLQEREVRPIGSSRTRRVDVRVIAATNRNLRREAGDALFRADLYYRLAVFPIHVPPLRERPLDILPLAEHFLRLHARRDRAREPLLASDARRLLQSYAWPGNVRELENEIQRALAVADPNRELTAAHFSRALGEAIEPVSALLQPGESLRATLARVEAWLIRSALEANGGARSATARRLGITREGLYKKMQRHAIN